jgi:murein DD-endopeptidase MepM/ murein hydrolase activator NlpD
VSRNGSRGDGASGFEDHDNGYTGEYDAAYTDERPVPDRSLAARDQGAYLPARYAEQPDALIIPGTGVSMGDPFILRRPRPLTMRVAVLTLMACIVVSGLFAATPLGSGASGYSSSFQALSGAVILRADADYFFYTAQPGDTPEKLATKFTVQVGGIYKLNNLLAGEELTVGKTYKIPHSATFGADYKPPSLYAAVADYGATTYGSSMWTSRAGDPPPEVPCGPDGHGTPIGYGLVAPNPGSGWVRGFTWFHNGVDMSAPRGVPIKAAQAGEVVWAGWANDGFGFSVKINHCNHISTAYGHMDALNVQVHDKVQPGDTIGFEGSTGWSTGPHLHFMVELDNVPIDPMPYYGYDRNKITGH